MRLLLILLLLLPVPALAQDWAAERLENSPRHLEWVTVDGTKCFLAYPEKSEKVPVVVVIHEIFGLTDWVRSLTDQLAQAGYIAIAPDFLTGREFSSVDEARQAIGELEPEEITARLQAVVEYADKLPAANGQVMVAGFCWGGTQAFRFATNNDAIDAAFVFYGTAPEDVSGITVPVYGFYAEKDARINATLEDTSKRMDEAGKSFEMEIYEDAGHGFMRAGEAPDASEANARAREKAWERWLKLLEAQGS